MLTLNQFHAYCKKRGYDAVHITAFYNAHNDELISVNTILINTYYMSINNIDYGDIAYEHHEVLSLAKAYAELQWPDGFLPTIDMLIRADMRQLCPKRARFPQPDESFELPF